MPQLSKDADEVLDEASAAIGEQKQILETAQRAHDELWERVIELMAEFNITRYVARDGYYLALQKRTGSPNLNESALERQIRINMTIDAAKELWESITERKVDPNKLEQAVASGRIPEEWLRDCLMPGKVSEARIRQPWTAKDRQLYE